MSQAIIDKNRPCALISVFDKTDLEDLANALVNQHNYQLVATGGTAQWLSQKGINVINSTQLTGFNELAGGRVKSLHPQLFGGILSPNPKQDEDLLCGIDLVIVNLYNFAQTAQQTDITAEALVEKIDIGGPSLLRAAAKNFARVTAISSPTQYPSLLKELAAGNGTPRKTFRAQCAGQVFQLTQAYDATIIAAWAQVSGETAPQNAPQAVTQATENTPKDLPQSLTLNLTQTQALRYGENPHQQAAVYQLQGIPNFGPSLRNTKENRLQFTTTGWISPPLGALLVSSTSNPPPPSLNTTPRAASP